MVVLLKILWQTKCFHTLSTEPTFLQILSMLCWLSSRCRTHRYWGHCLCKMHKWMNNWMMGLKYALLDTSLIFFLSIGPYTGFSLFWCTKDDALAVETLHTHCCLKVETLVMPIIQYKPKSPWESWILLAFLPMSSAAWSTCEQDIYCVLDLKRTYNLDG